MREQTFVFGPYMVRGSEPRVIDADIAETGCFLEFATPDEGPRLPIFRCAGFSCLGPQFSNYFIRENDLPFEIMAYGIQVKHYTGGPYIRLTAFLAGMYKHFNGLRPVQDFLGDFQNMLPVETFNNPASMEYPLKAFAASSGYQVLSVFPYGRRVCVDIGWRFPQKRANETPFAYLTIAGIDFRPRPDRTLGPGKWRVRWEHTVEHLLFDKLRSMTGNDPVFLFEEAAKARMLDKFDWTPLAQMTGKQAREARIEFIQKHDGLIGDPKVLAQALKDAGLYSSETSVYQICKFLPSLVSAISGGHRALQIPRRRKFTEVYQLKIELEVLPLVWRRIQVPATFSFWELHSAIQDAMGWKDCHLHEFTFDFDPETKKEKRISIPDSDFGNDELLAEFTSYQGDEFEEKIVQWLTKDRPTISYRYDFGDQWCHTIALEKVLPADDETDYPICIAGERACPPENCGGPYGYEDLCRCVKKRSQNVKFVPDRFAPDKVVFEDPRKRKKRLLSEGS